MGILLIFHTHISGQNVLTPKSTELLRQFEVFLRPLSSMHLTKSKPKESLSVQIDLLHQMRALSERKIFHDLDIRAFEYSIIRIISSIRIVITGFEYYFRIRISTTAQLARLRLSAVDVRLVNAARDHSSRSETRVPPPPGAVSGINSSSSAVYFTDLGNYR